MKQAAPLSGARHKADALHDELCMLCHAALPPAAPSTPYFADGSMAARSPVATAVPATALLRAAPRGAMGAATPPGGSTTRSMHSDGGSSIL